MLGPPADCQPISKHDRANQQFDPSSQKRPEMQVVGKVPMKHVTHQQQSLNETITNKPVVMQLIDPSNGFCLYSNTLQSHSQHSLRLGIRPSLSLTSSIPAGCISTTNSQACYWVA